MFALNIFALIDHRHDVLGVQFCCGCGIALDQAGTATDWVFCRRHGHWRYLFMLTIPGGPFLSLN